MAVFKLFTHADETALQIYIDRLADAAIAYKSVVTPITQLLSLYVRLRYRYV